MKFIGLIFLFFIISCTFEQSKNVLYKTDFNEEVIVKLSNKLNYSSNKVQVGEVNKNFFKIVNNYFREKFQLKSLSQAFSIAPKDHIQTITVLPIMSVKVKIPRTIARSRLAIIYHTQMDQGASHIGIIPSDHLTITSNYVLFDTNQFGRYQLVEVSDELLKKYSIKTIIPVKEITFNPLL